MNQTTACEPNTIWLGDSNPRAKYFGLSILYQILSFSQLITNQATICELNTIWPSDSDPRSYCCELVSWIQYDQEIPIPGPTFVSCLQYNRFLQTSRYYSSKRTTNKRISSACILNSKHWIITLKCHDFQSSLKMELCHSKVTLNIITFI